jgi:hypothetical protein
MGYTENNYIDKRESILYHSGIYTLVDAFLFDYGGQKLKDNVSFFTIEIDNEGRHNIWWPKSSKCIQEKEYTALETECGMKRMRVLSENIIKFELDPTDISNSITRHCDILLEFAKNCSSMPLACRLMKFKFEDFVYDVKQDNGVIQIQTNKDFFRAHRS